MHASCYDWVGKVVAEHGLADRPTLEVGSQDVNGTIRDHFTGEYLGVDMAPGRGVDRIADAEHLDFHDNSWPAVISTEMLEHCPRPWVAVAEMARVCAPGGYVIVTARGYDERGCWEVHGYPADHWRMAASAMRIMAEDAGLRVIRCERDPEGPGWFLLAVKP